MIQGIYSSVAGALVQQARVNVIGNNIANANTNGYKRDTAVFQHRLSEALENPELRHKSNLSLTPLGGGIYMDESVTMHREKGAVQKTGNPLDLMINGDGFFKLVKNNEAGEKEYRYTRNGSFSLNAKGYVVDETGEWHLQDSRENKIFLGDATDLEFETNGEFRVNGEIKGTISMADFKNEDLWLLKKVGQNLFSADEKIEEEPFAGNVIPGALEGSTANYMESMVEMIQTQRNYDLNMKMITLQDQTLDRAINQVGNVQA